MMMILIYVDNILLNYIKLLYNLFKPDGTIVLHGNK